MKASTGLFAALAVLFATDVQSAVVLDRVAPVSGPPGTHVILYGQGFALDSKIQVNGLAAAIVEAQANQIEFIVPVGALSGWVAIEVAGVWFTNAGPFTVTRQIPGQFNPPAGVNRAGYRIVGDGGFIPINSTDGTFPAMVSVENVDLLWALRTANESAFMAMLPPGRNQAVLDAASTAEAFILMNPLVNGRPLERYTNLVSAVRALPEFTELSSLIASISSAGRDYLDDARVEDASVRAIQTLLQSLPAAPNNQAKFFEPGTPNGTELKYLNPPGDYFGYPDLRRLKTEIKTPNSQHLDHFRLAFGSAGRFAPVENPVDWFVEVYQLDPAQFPGGFHSVGALSFSNRPAKLSTSALDRGIVSAKLFGSNLDILSQAAGAVVSKLFARSVDELGSFTAANEIPVPALRPGIYVSEAYSGNIFWGTELFLNSPPSQSQLITDLGGRDNWTISLSGNILAATIDMVSTVVNVRTFLGSDNQSENLKLVKNVATQIRKDLALYQNQPLPKDYVYDLVKSKAKSVLKSLAEKALANGAELGIEEYGTKVLKTVGKSFDVLAKAGSFLQAVERSTGIVANSVLGVERSITIVGNPFAPTMTSFFPQSGRGGEVLTIQGTHFNMDTNFLRVGFCQFANTEDPTNITDRLDLEIISVTAGSIAARVPTNGVSKFPNLKALVFIESGTNRLFITSARLNPPFREFRFTGFPTISTVYPNPVRPGGLLEIRGTGFENFTARDTRILIDGEEQALGNAANDTRITVRVPPGISTGSHTLALMLRDFTTPGIPFQVQPPAYATTPGQGFVISVTKNDFSNDPEDGKISVLEGILIGAGLRVPREHDPCEFLPLEDPLSCPYQEREIDHVSGNNGGAGIADRIVFAANMVISGPLPVLSENDSYVFGAAGQPVTLDGSGAGNVAGLLLNGTSNIRIGGNLIIQNFTGNGVHLKNGANNNFFENIVVQNCNNNGVFLEGDASLNEFRHTSISNVAGHGFYFSGNAVRLNDISSTLGGFGTSYHLITDCGGSGIRLDNGANFNAILPGTIRDCGAAGIHLSGAGTQNNFFGRVYDDLQRSYDLVNNNGPGAYIGPGAVGNTFRYLNPIGNQGDGVLLEGPGCSNNVVDRTFAGANLYEGGTSLAIGNEGSGIRLANGAQFNLIGARSVSFGGYGAIVGNRDNGVLLEGANTAFNTVNAQVIGVQDPSVLPYSYAGNGLAAIALRNGARDNFIGDQNSGLANVIFASPVGIEIANNGTDHNFIFGNQLGSFFNGVNIVVDSGIGRNGTGVWIHNGPRGNIIGFPSQRIPVPRFSGDSYPEYHQTYNVIGSCTNVGVLLENASGDVGTDGVLSSANIIQGNRIGELHNGNLAPRGETGIKLGAGATANIIGGPLPEQGNRIRGWNRAGIWIDQNHLSSARMRNRFENNYADNIGQANQPAYLDQTPGGVGFLVTSSTGHTIGESLLTPNKFYTTRVAVYLADSSSNIVRGFYITNNFNAGIVVRGGGGNKIGGGTVNDGNLVHAIGLNGALPWSAIALSETSGNILRGNEIGFLAPGRGSVGILITNASDNIFGGAAAVNGNYVISNPTNGIVLTGPATAGNKFFNNSIGVDRDGNISANLGDGIRIENGAHDNFIGGLADLTVGNLNSSIPAGNVIAHSSGAGVRVVGAATKGNRILYNSITANGDRGIRHENGGNNLMPPPVLLAHDGTSVSGNVADLGVTPAGSIVQVFSDPDNLDPEGDAFLGEAIVQANGNWKANGVLIHSIMTMTATHAVTGSTSEFGTGGAASIGFHVARTDNVPEETMSPGANRASVLKLSVRAINADVRVNTMAFDAQGTLPDATGVVAAHLYRDADGDGNITDTDFLLGGPITFGADNGRITFTDLNAVIESGVTQKWIVTYQLAAEAPEGSNFILVLTNAAAVAAKYVNPVNLDVTPLGNFAIESASFTVVAAPPGQTFAAWRTAVFSPEQLLDPLISGPYADHDGDGVMTLGEYAHNLNPLQPDRDAPTATGTGGLPRARIVTALDPNSGQQRPFLELLFVRRKAPVDLVYEPQHSDSLQSWLDALGGSAFLVLQEIQEINPPGTVERVRYRTAQPITGQKYFRVRVTHTP